MGTFRLGFPDILVWLFLLIFGISSCKEHAATDHSLFPPYASTGKVIMYDSLLLSVLDTASPVEIIGQGFNWSEGPLWLPEQKKLLFSDVPENVIYVWEEQSGIAEYLKPAGYTGPSSVKAEGSNGLALDNDGNLIICQHGDRSVAKMKADLNHPKADYFPLATNYNGKKFNSPNDLCISSGGDIFFTDPPYGLPGQDDDPAREMEFNGVYRLMSNGSVLLIDAELTRPNGVALSGDEKKLYVANSDPARAIWMEYTLDDFFNPVSKKVLLDRTGDVASKKGLPDGLKVHSSGLLFATGPGGVLIIHPDGRHLGTIDTGQATANCAFDADENYLYMTADDFLMRVRLRK
jgi:gluconolactonase